MDALDFDAAWASEQAEPLVARVHGVGYELPGSKPAGLTLHMHRIRAERGPGAELSFAELEACARYLLGPEALQVLLDDQISEEHLTDFVLGVMAEYYRRDQATKPPVGQGDDPPGEAFGASEAPTT